MASTLADLMDNSDIFLRVTSYLSLRELHKDRVVAVAFRDACDEDPRWLPVIAPPSLAHEVLDLTNKDHNKQLRRLYFQYWEWLRTWNDAEDERDEDFLLARKSHLDGFFSLAPWVGRSKNVVYTRTSPYYREDPIVSIVSYPTPWLHRMVYEQLCPTEISPSMRGQLRPLNPSDPSRFFQQRVRYEEDVFRTFTSSPIDPYRVPQEQFRRVLLQPVNLRNLDGKKHPKLPDHREETIDGLDHVFKSILQCYFGETGTHVPPVYTHCAKLTRRRYGGFCRNDVQGRVNADGSRVVQVNPGALLGVRTANIWGENTEDAAIVLLIAPHLYPSNDNLAWCFSTPLSRHDHAWVISTYQFYEYNDNSAKALCQLMGSILYTVLYQLEMGSVCENKCCALNNADGVGEAEESAHLIVCPSCLWKLHLGGVIKDVPAFLQNLAAVLQQEPFANYCRRDREMLSSWGYDGPKKKQKR